MFPHHLEEAGDDSGNAVKEVTVYKILCILQYTARLTFDMHEIA